MISPDTTPLVQGMTTAEPTRNLEQRNRIGPLPSAIRITFLNGKEKLNGISLEDRRLVFRGFGRRIYGPPWKRPSTRPFRERLARRIQSRTLAGWATALEKCSQLPPNRCKKSQYFPIARAVNLSAALMWPKDGLESMLSLLIRHFRPRRFFTH